MRKLALRTTVALLTLTLGVIASVGMRSLNRPPQPQPQPPPPCPTPTVEPPKVEPVEEVLPEYPDDRDVAPWDIEYFIDQNPQANLEKLWKRLGRSGKSDSLHLQAAGDFNFCYDCEADSFEYDLDGEPGDETILKISSPVMESFRYLIFKYEGDRQAKWRLLGLIDEWGKYKESKHLVVLGNGRPLLLVQGQAVSGSGVASYLNRLFLVTPHGIKQILIYPAEGHQSGWFTGPDREFTGQLSSYQIKNGQIEVALKFEVKYCDYDVGKEVPLISKTQTALYSGPLNGTLKLELHKSTLTERELEHVYNIDSMTEMDFLKYNYSELLKLANHGNQKQKRWLKDYLQTCTNSAEKRTLLGAVGK